VLTGRPGVNTEEDRPFRPFSKVLIHSLSVLLIYSFFDGRAQPWCCTALVKVVPTPGIVGWTRTQAHTARLTCSATHLLIVTW
jgi:hypothetical protein